MQPLRYILVNQLYYGHLGHEVNYEPITSSRLSLNRLSLSFHKLAMHIFRNKKTAFR